MKVLYADDDIQVRDYVSMLLEAGLDCEILEASSGNEALSILSFESDIDFVITEVTMKGGNGNVIVDYLDAEKLKIPIVWLSDPVNKDVLLVQEVLKRSELNAFVAKPFRDDEFFPVIDKILSLKESAQSEADRDDNVDQNENEYENKYEDEDEEVSFDDDEFLWDELKEESNPTKSQSSEDDSSSGENPFRDSYNEISKKENQKENQNQAHEENPSKSKFSDDDWNYGQNKKKKNTEEVELDYSIPKKKKGEEIELDYSIPKKKKGEEIELDYSIPKKEYGEADEAGYSLKKDFHSAGEESLDLSSDKKEYKEEELDLSREKKNLAEEELDLSREKKDQSTEELDLSGERKNLADEELDYGRDKKKSDEEELDLTEGSQQGSGGKKNGGISTQSSLEATSAKQEYDKERFKRVKLKRFLNFSRMSCDVYIQLSRLKYLKVINAEEEYSKDMIERYRDKGKEFLFVEHEDYEKFSHQFSDLVSAKLAKAQKLSPEIKTIAELAAFENTIEMAKEYGINKATAEKVKQSIESNLNSFKSSPKLGDLLKRIMRGGDYISEHSLLLSYIAGQICMATGWGNAQTLEKLSMAAMFHDTTLEKNEWAKFQTLEEAKNAGLSSEDIEKIKSHPGEAAKLISSGEHIFADVDAIIIQHHERPDKLGFPRGLGALSISPLSCIFILASEFVDEIYGKPPHEVDIESIKAKMSDIYNVGNFKKPLEAFLKVF